jgi:phosphoribosylanthranilate isomerase
VTLVKICGIKTFEEARIALEAGAWAIGEVFAPSPRRLEVVSAAAINKRLGQTVVKIGVFVNEGLEQVREIVTLCHLDMVQLHGEEPPEYLPEIPVPVIKSFPVKGPLTVKQIQQWPAWAYHLDAYRSGLRGGTGQVFNWDWIPCLPGLARIILSGGLNEYNIEFAIRQIRPMAVDISSGVEFPGRGKDPDKIKRFIEKVKEVDTLVSRT